MMLFAIPLFATLYNFRFIWASYKCEPMETKMQHWEIFILLQWQIKELIKSLWRQRSLTIPWPNLDCKPWLILDYFLTKTLAVNSMENQVQPKNWGIFKLLSSLLKHIQDLFYLVRRWNQTTANPFLSYTVFHHCWLFSDKKLTEKILGSWY